MAEAEILNSESHYDETTGALRNNVNLRAARDPDMVIDEVSESGVVIPKEAYAATYTADAAMVSIRNIPVLDEATYDVTFKAFEPPPPAPEPEADAEP